MFDSRAPRQEEKITKIVFIGRSGINLVTKKSAEDLSALLQKCEPGGLNLWSLSIKGNIEADGWAALGKALILHQSQFV